MSVHSLLTSSTQWLARRAGLLIIALGFVMLAAYLTAILAFPKPSGRIIFGDATHTFVQLRSIVFDHDLDLRDEYALLRVTPVGPNEDSVLLDLTPTGHIGTYMPIGPAVLWAPLYLLIAALQTVLAWLGLAPFPNGFDRPLQLVPGVMGVAAATAGAYLSWRLARRFTDDVSAVLGTVAVWLGTHALYYSLVSPSYSHAASMLTASVFFTYWIATRDRLTVRRLALLGAFAGLSALMRWQDGLFLTVPLIEALRWRTTWARRFGGAAAAGVGWLVAFSPQMIVWTALYGRPFAVPQGPSFMKWGQPHLVDVLLSDNHGLLSWAPLLVLALAGLLVFLARHRTLVPVVVTVLLASWYVNASVADWWAGEAFGARRFLSLFPLFVIGFAVWLQGDGRQTRRWSARLAVTAAFVVANGLLLLQYELAMKGAVSIAPFPTGWSDLLVARFLVPVRLLMLWHH